MPKVNWAGFTLIEMSVVLVIIGLLTAAIVVGRSMIRSSDVQTIISDVATYQTAIGQFKQKYSEVPGDMADATGYWGTNPNCSIEGGVGTGTQTCNGNGDGQITYSAPGVRPHEQFLVWQHLANAGLISGQYTGTSASAPTPRRYCQVGLNCPGGHVNQRQAYFLQYVTAGTSFDGTNSNDFWSQESGHYMIVGASGINGGGNAYPGNPFLTAAEALSLDSKVDDGLPGQGRWKSFETGANGDAEGYLPYCVVVSGGNSPPGDGSVASASTSVYNTAYSSAKPACSFEIQMTF